MKNRLCSSGLSGKILEISDHGTFEFGGEKEESESKKSRSLLRIGGGGDRLAECCQIKSYWQRGVEV